MEDGSSLVCVRCGALIARTRLEQHKKYWCDKLDNMSSSSNNNTLSEIDESNSDFDDLDSDVEMDDMTNRFNTTTM